MSIRPQEASRFSLRAVVAEEALEERKFVLNGIVHTPKQTSVQASGGKGLRFDFSSLQKKTPAADEAQRGKPFIAPMKNAFDVSNESSKADVMRLTIMVEDLNSRVKKASERAAAAKAAAESATKTADTGDQVIETSQTMTPLNTPAPADFFPSHLVMVHHRRFALC